MSQASIARPAVAVRLDQHQIPRRAERVHLQLVVGVRIAIGIDEDLEVVVVKDDGVARGQRAPEVGLLHLGRHVEVLVVPQHLRAGVESAAAAGCRPRCPRTVGPGGSGPAWLVEFAVDLQSSTARDKPRIAAVRRAWLRSRASPSGMRAPPRASNSTPPRKECIVLNVILPGVARASTLSAPPAGRTSPRFLAAAEDTPGCLPRRGQRTRRRAHHRPWRCRSAPQRSAHLARACRSVGP